MKRLMLVLCTSFIAVSSSSEIISSVRTNESKISFYDLNSIESFKEHKESYTESELENFERKFNSMANYFEQNSITYKNVSKSNWSHVINLYHQYVSNVNNLTENESRVMLMNLRDIAFYNNYIEKSQKKFEQLKSPQRQNYSLSDKCTFGGYDANGNYRQIIYKDTGEVLLMRNPINKYATIEYSDKFSASSVSGFEYDSWTKQRYVIYLNTCEATLLYAYRKRMDISELIYNQRRNAPTFIWIKSILTAYNIIKLAASQLSVPNDHYYDYLRGLLAADATPENIVKASKNFTEGIAAQFWWRMFKKNFLSFNNQKRMDNNEELYFLWETDADYVRYNYHHDFNSGSSSNYNIAKVTKTDTWRDDIDAFTKNWNSIRSIFEALK